MGDRKFKQKTRNDKKRKKEPVIFITAEGKNKTETLYFDSFNAENSKYHIHFVKAGTDTDPEGMFQSMKEYLKRNGLSVEDGYKAFVVLDLDCDDSKMKTIKKLQKESKDIQFIVSNPCIEVWFILHFGYTTHHFNDSKDAKRYLKRNHIRNYEENLDVSRILRPSLDKAQKSVNELRKYYKNNRMKWGDSKFNPMTDVDIIIAELGI